MDDETETPYVHNSRLLDPGLWAVAVTVYNRPKEYAATSITFVRAAGMDEAVGKATRLAAEKFPVPDGWDRPLVLATRPEACTIDAVAGPGDATRVI